MADQTIPKFDDDYGGVIAPTAPPLPQLDRQRVEQRRRMFTPHFDLYLLVIVAALSAFGLLMVYSSSIDASFLATEDTTTTYFFTRQFRNFVIGLVALYVMARLDYRIWKQLSIPMMIVIMFTLVAVLQFGDRRLEAQRALFRGSFQPGEAAKLVVVIYMAAWLSSKKDKIRNVTYGLFPFSVMVGAVTLLIALQPDLSTAASILATTLTMFFLAGASWTQLGLLAGGAIFAGWTLATQLPYAESRIQGHLSAINDLSQANDHVQAAIVAFLNGGLFGVGLGEGRQKFGALPFPHTDSVFAVIGEELGLFGCFVVIALYFGMVYRGFWVASNSRDSFGALLSAGVVCWLGYDALLNIAVMTAVIPPTGVPLPFISFGGSSLVAALSGIGLVLSVSRVSARPLPPERRQLRELDEVSKETRKDSRSEKPRQKRVEKASPHEVDEHTIKQAREERRQQRRESITQARRERLKHRDEGESPTQGLPDIDEWLNPESLTNTVSAKPERPTQAISQPAVPADETAVIASENGHDNDPDSDLGRRNRRRRISRISGN